MLEHFHFIHPLWLLALAPLALLAWITFQPDRELNAWKRVVDARLLPLMMADATRGVSKSALVLAATGWTLAALALADPTWALKPQPVFQTNAARVVVLDLSSSMNQTDLKPSRLARARYKVEDVLSQATEGQTALVAYAGDAFTVSPLTRDASTIRSLLKVLEPALMPVDGERADLGLSKAGALLHQAGMTSGQILLIADGVDAGKVADTERAAVRLKSAGYSVSVLGVGTPSGDTLASVAHAGGGLYRPMTDNGAGLQALLDAGVPAGRATASQTKATAQAWKDSGPLIVVLLLPLAALAFRRNWLVSAALLAVLVAPAQAAMASTWADAWQRPDQQASKALKAGDYAKAAAIAPDAVQRGSAEYKSGDYQSALKDFSGASGADADYNRGNALAKLGRYREAIAAYDKAISESSSHDDSTANKSAVEALLKKKPEPPKQDQQQQKQQQEQQSSASKDGGKQGDQDKNGSQGKSQDGQQGASAKPASGGQEKGSAGTTQADASSKGDNSGKSPAMPKPGDRGNSGTPKDSQAGAVASKTPASPKPDTAGHDESANPSPSKPQGNSFAQAAQQVGKPAEAGAGEADSHSSQKDPVKAAPNPAGPARPEAGAAQAPGADAKAQPIEGEEKLAADQWLQRIPDDPGGLLRRKFLYQYSQRAAQGDPGDQ